MKLKIYKTKNLNSLFQNVYLYTSKKNIKELYKINKHFDFAFIFNNFDVKTVVTHKLHIDFKNNLLININDLNNKKHYIKYFKYKKCFLYKNDVFYNIKDVNNLELKKYFFDIKNNFVIEINEPIEIILKSIIYKFKKTLYIQIEPVAIDNKVFEFIELTKFKVIQFQNRYANKLNAFQIRFLTKIDLDKTLKFCQKIKIEKFKKIVVF